MSSSPALTAGFCARPREELSRAIALAMGRKQDEWWKVGHWVEISVVPSRSGSRPETERKPQLHGGLSLRDLTGKTSSGNLTIHMDGGDRRSGAR